MKSKKNILIVVASVCIILLIVIFFMRSNPDGSSLESRESMLSSLSKLRNKNPDICYEIKIDGYIVSGFNFLNNMHGLAIFQPRKKGKYSFQSDYLRESDELIHGNVIINQKSYDLFWANKDNLDYIEITYIFFDGSNETLRLDASDNKIIYKEAPFDDYTVEYAFVDKNGNRYE